jgi:probable aminopeptidase NPEPL1
MLLLSALPLGMRVAAPPPARLVFEPPALVTARKYVVCGTKSALLSDGAKDLLPLGLPFQRWQYLVELADEEMGADGSKANWMFTAADGRPSTIVAAVLPDECSRHASPVRPHAIHNLFKGTKSANVLVVLDDAAHAGGTACAIGRAFPTVNAKTRWRPGAGNEPADAEPPVVRVGFATRAGALSDGYSSYAAAAEGVRRAARLVDLPPDVLTTSAFVGEVPREQPPSRTTAFTT